MVTKLIVSGQDLEYPWGQVDNIILIDSIGGASSFNENSSTKV